MRLIALGVIGLNLASASDGQRKLQGVESSFVETHMTFTYEGVDGELLTPAIEAYITDVLMFVQGKLAVNENITPLSMHLLETETFASEDDSGSSEGSGGRNLRALAGRRKGGGSNVYTGGFSCYLCPRKRRAEAEEAVASNGENVAVGSFMSESTIEAWGTETCTILAEGPYEALWEIHNCKIDIRVL